MTHEELNKISYCYFFVLVFKGYNPILNGVDDGCILNLLLCAKCAHRPQWSVYSILTPLQFIRSEVCIVHENGLPSLPRLIFRN